MIPTRPDQPCDHVGPNSIVVVCGRRRVCWRARVPAGLGTAFGYGPRIGGWSRQKTAADVRRTDRWPAIWSRRGYRSPRPTSRSRSSR